MTSNIGNTTTLTENVRSCIVTQMLDSKVFAGVLLATFINFTDATCLNTGERPGAAVRPTAETTPPHPWQRPSATSRSLADEAVLASIWDQAANYIRSRGVDPDSLLARVGQALEQVNARGVANGLPVDDAQEDA